MTDYAALLRQIAREIATEYGPRKAKPATEPLRKAIAAMDALRRGKR